MILRSIQEYLTASWSSIVYQYSIFNMVLSNISSTLWIYQASTIFTHLYCAQKLHLLHGLTQRSVGLQHASHQLLSSCDQTERCLHFLWIEHQNTTTKSASMWCIDLEFTRLSITTTHNTSFPIVLRDWFKEVHTTEFFTKPVKFKNYKSLKNHSRTHFQQSQNGKNWFLHFPMQQQGSL